MHSAVEFCDSSFAIMVSKAPSGPSGSQELRAHHTAPGPHGTHPPSHCAAGSQPSFLFSAAGLFHPARLDRPLCFAPALLVSLACTCIVCTCMHAHARSADALQFLRSHAPLPAHDDSMILLKSLKIVDYVVLCSYCISYLQLKTTIR